jgi:hypothetical protein
MFYNIFIILKKIKKIKKIYGKFNQTTKQRK